MKTVKRFAQIFSVQMRINFGRRDAFMTKHFLHSP